jgi:adenosylcobinamide-GDP ribazoletransferase
LVVFNTGGPTLGILAAFQFLTLLPIKRSFTPGQIGRSTVYFPLVGLAIGLVLAGLNYLLSLVLPGSIVNVLLVAALAVTSGGLHLDGLADTFDGIAGHRTPQQRLEIMRDSRIGGFGAIAIGLFLLIEFVSLNSLPAGQKLSVLILAPAISRWAMVYSIFAYPYARPTGLGRAFKDAVSWPHLALATLVTAVAAGVLFKVAGVVVLAGSWVVVILFAAYLKHQLRGLTGDTYGAINEIVTTTVFILMSLLSFKHWLMF